MTKYHYFFMGLKISLFVSSEHKSSVLYNEKGLLINLDETIEGKLFFRKRAFFKDLINDYEIAKILLNEKNPNIVEIYNISIINQLYYEIDIELVNTDYSISILEKNKQVLIELKNFLQSKGIMYIDWKPDNFGIDEKGNIKIFDFDASGIISIENFETWLIKPPNYWAYKMANLKGLSKPKEIDDYCFNTFINSL
jgi:serine/threonine protein kinase